MGYRCEETKVRRKGLKTEDTCYLLSFPFLLKSFVLLMFTYPLLVSTGCEQSFQPFKKSEQHLFSIYGYLDASADTQWVRITPTRRQLQMPPVTPDMQLMLEELQTGASIQMNDSLFLQANGFHYLNFWTTMDIKPEHTYRLTAIDSVGNTSRVTVTIPEDFSTPEVEYGGSQQCHALINTQHINNLADLHTRWHVSIPSTGNIERTYHIPYRSGIRESGVFAHMVEVDVKSDLEYINSIFTNVDINSVTIFIASGGPEWSKEIASLNDVEYALPESTSNVENGLGYVIGIVSKSIPYEGDCPVITGKDFGE